MSLVALTRALSRCVRPPEAAAKQPRHEVRVRLGECLWGVYFTRNWNETRLCINVLTDSVGSKKFCTCVPYIVQSEVNVPAQFTGYSMVYIE
jgi:hypothetical protein